MFTYGRCPLADFRLHIYYPEVLSWVSVANHSTPKTLFTCVVFTNVWFDWGVVYPPRLKCKAVVMTFVMEHETFCVWLFVMGRQGKSTCLPSYVAWPGSLLVLILVWEIFCWGNVVFFPPHKSAFLIAIWTGNMFITNSKIFMSLKSSLK